MVLACDLHVSTVQFGLVDSSFWRDLDVSNVQFGMVDSSCLRAWRVNYARLLSRVLSALKLSCSALAGWCLEVCLFQCLNAPFVCAKCVILARAGELCAIFEEGSLCPQALVLSSGWLVPVCVLYL